MGLLGLVHGLVGMAHQLGECVAVVRAARHPDAHPHTQRLPLVAQGQGYGAAQLVRQLAQALRWQGVGQQDDKFIASQARHDVVGAYQRLHAFGHSLQYGISGVVAVSQREGCAL